MCNDLKKRAVQEKGGSCILCGYNRCNRSLHFHHMNDFEKEFNISQSNSWEEIVEELRKCALVCANCHGEIHSGFVDLEVLVQLNEI